MAESIDRVENQGSKSWMSSSPTMIDFPHRPLLT